MPQTTVVPACQNTSFSAPLQPIRVANTDPDIGHTAASSCRIKALLSAWQHVALVMGVHEQVMVT